MKDTEGQYFFLLIILQVIRVLLNRSIYNKLHPNKPIKLKPHTPLSIFDSTKEYNDKNGSIIDFWYLIGVLFWIKFPKPTLGRVQALIVLLISVYSIFLIYFLFNVNN